MKSLTDMPPLCSLGFGLFMAPFQMGDLVSAFKAGQKTVKARV